MAKRHCTPSSSSSLPCFGTKFMLLFTPSTISVETLMSACTCAAHPEIPRLPPGVRSGRDAHVAGDSELDPLRARRTLRSRHDAHPPGVSVLNTLCTCAAHPETPRLPPGVR